MRLCIKPPSPGRSWKSFYKVRSASMQRRAAAARIAICTPQRRAAAASGARARACSRGTWGCRRAQGVERREGRGYRAGLLASLCSYTPCCASRRRHPTHLSVNATPAPSDLRQPQKQSQLYAQSVSQTLAVLGERGEARHIEQGIESLASTQTRRTLAQPRRGPHARVAAHLVSATGRGLPAGAKCSPAGSP